jgi:hypothetical protein
MAAFILISDPLLLLPQERAEILGIMKKQTELSGTGIFLQYKNLFFEDGHLPVWLTDNYLCLPWLVLSAAALFAGIFSKNKYQRTVAIVLLCYLVTACTINLNAAASRLHYFLPIMLPLTASLPWLIEIVPEHFRKQANAVFCIILLLQIGLNFRTNAGLLKTQLYREENSLSIALYNILAADHLPLPEVPENRMTRIYRDWKVYFPEQEGYAVKTDWDLASFGMIDEWHPDLILLEKENIRAYGKEEILDQAVNTDKMADTVRFYKSALEKNIPGYEFLFENGFGIVFRKELP